MEFKLHSFDRYNIVYLIVIATLLYLSYLYIKEFIFDVPVIIYPYNGEVIDPEWVRFYWNPVEKGNNVSYEIQVFHNCDMSANDSLNWETKELILQPSIYDFKPGSNYCWRIRAIIGDSVGSWAGLNYFYINNKPMTYFYVSNKPMA